MKNNELTVVSESHLDHGFTAQQKQYLLELFGDRTAFFLEQVVLPEELGTVPCALHGPATGRPPVPDSLTYRAKRGNRSWESRMTDLPPVQSRMVVVIGGPHEEKCNICDEYGMFYSIGAAMRFGGGDGMVRCPKCNGQKVIKYACVLYTMYGGPVAPQEPGDPNCKNLGDSEAFWSQHALSKM